MRKDTNYFRRIELDYFFKMAKLCLSKAYKHIEEDDFWIWMDNYSEYSRKYFELYSKIGL